MEVLTQRKFMGVLSMQGINWEQPFHRVVERCLPDRADDLLDGKTMCTTLEFELDADEYQELSQCASTLARDPYPSNQLARYDGRIVENMLAQLRGAGTIEFKTCLGSLDSFLPPPDNGKLRALLKKFMPHVDPETAMAPLIGTFSLAFPFLAPDISDFFSNMNLILGAQVVDSHIPDNPKHLLIIYLDSHTADIQASKARNYARLYEMGIRHVYGEGFISEGNYGCSNGEAHVNDIYVDSLMDTDERSYVQACEPFKGNVTILGIEDRNRFSRGENPCNRDFKSPYHRLHCINGEAGERSDYAARLVRRSMKERDLKVAVIDYGAQHYTRFSEGLHGSNIAYIALLPPEFSKQEWNYLLSLQRPEKDFSN